MGAVPTTHVANGCNRDIWAHVGSDGKHIFQSIDVGYKQGKVSVVLNESRQTIGFTRITPGNVIPFQPTAGIGGANWFHRSNVYISIYYYDGEAHWICQDYTLASNHSCIVAADYTVRATKMGELWIDRTTGENHEP